MKFLRKIKIRRQFPTAKKNKLSKRHRLAELIRHANMHSPFYAGYFELFLQTERNLTDEEFFYAFSHLPIIEKNHLKKHYDSFRCIQSDEKTPQNQHIKDILNILLNKTQKSSAEKDLSQQLWTNTQDAGIFAQGFLQSLRLNGWTSGERLVAYYPMTSDLSLNTQALNHSLGLKLVPFKTVTKESVEELLRALRKTKVKVLITSPSTLQRVSQMMHDASLPPLERLPYINLSGEHLMDCSKSFIQTQFPDSDIQTSYGTLETGIIAHQKGLNSADYTTFTDFAYIEQGEHNTILVTPYDQAAFPLIRYRIEDMGRLINHENETQSILSLEGKNTDYIVGADGYMYCTSFFNNFVNEINKALNNPVIHFSLRHNTIDRLKVLQLNFVLSNPEKMRKVQEVALDTCHKVFSNYDQIDIAFLNSLELSSNKNFKIIDRDEKLYIKNADQNNHRVAS